MNINGFGPGDLVAFQHRDGLAVGYVDSVDTAANVVASVVRPGLWKERGNPSLDVACWRVAFKDLRLLQRAGCSDGCGAAVDAHCWNDSDWAVESGGK